MPSRSKPVPIRRLRAGTYIVDWNAPLPASAEQRLREYAAPAEVADFLEQPYAVDDSCVARYQQQGYTRLTGVLTGAALEHYREMLGLAVRHLFRLDTRAQAEKSVYEQSFLQAHTLGLKYAAVRAFVHARRFAGIAKQLMGAEGVRYYFDQALYKEPGGRLTDYHQDSGYWPVEPAHMTATIWIALVDVPVQMGCMAFAQDCYDPQEPARFINIFGAEQELEYRGAARHARWDWQPLAAGDATVHSGLTYHRAGANQTQQMREAMTIAYMSHDATYDWPESNPRIETWGPWAIQGLKRGAAYTSINTPRLL
jgi:hypothetical protein